MSIRVTVAVFVPVLPAERFKTSGVGQTQRGEQDACLIASPVGFWPQGNGIGVHCVADYLAPHIDHYASFRVP